MEAAVGDTTSEIIGRDDEVFMLARGRIRQTFPQDEYTRIVDVLLLNVNDTEAIISGYIAKERARWVKR